MIYNICGIFCSKLKSHNDHEVKVNIFIDLRFLIPYVALKKISSNPGNKSKNEKWIIIQHEFCSCNHNSQLRPHIIQFSFIQLNQLKTVACACYLMRFFSPYV